VLRFVAKCGARFSPLSIPLPAPPQGGLIEEVVGDGFPVPDQRYVRSDLMTRA